LLSRGCGLLRRRRRSGWLSRRGGGSLLFAAATAAIRRQTDKRDRRGCRHQKNFPHIILSILAIQVTTLEALSDPSLRQFQAFCCRFWRTRQDSNL
jgi:hypothetical protein